MKVRHFSQRNGAFNMSRCWRQSISEVLEGKLLHIMDTQGSLEHDLIEPDDRPDWRIPFVSPRDYPRFT
jgi:hypothetical protein